MLKKTFIVFCAVLFLSACGGRVPTAKTAQSTAKTHFKKYGRQYANTSYNRDNFRSVQINQIQELSYKKVLVDALVSFKNGERARVLLTMDNKFPRGWRVISWEQVLLR